MIDDLLAGCVATLSFAAAAALDARGRFTLALSGGSTPAPLYRRLASPESDSALPWSKTHVIWGDERCVPPDDERSNYHLAASSGLLDRPLAGIHRMRGELRPEEAATAYEAELRGLVVEGASDGPRVRPPLDAIILGLGPEGHTASLFPGDDSLEVTDRLVVATPAHGGMRRLSLTLPFLASASVLLFLVAGGEKAEIVRRVTGGRRHELPATRVVEAALRAGRRVVWLLDEGASSRLSL